MFSKKNRTVVMTEYGSFFIYYFPLLFLSQKIHVHRLYFSSFSWNKLSKFRNSNFLYKVYFLLMSIIKLDKNSFLSHLYLTLFPNRISKFDANNFVPQSCDYLCSLGFMRKIPYTQIEVSKSSTNIHWSLLPQYAGCHPYYWVFRENQKYSGITIHKIAEDYDSGNIIIQKRIPISEIETSISFRKKAAKESISLFKNYLKNKKKLDQISIKQNRNDYTFYKSPKVNDFIISFNDSCEEIIGKFRAAPDSCHVVLNRQKKKVNSIITKTGIIFFSHQRAKIKSCKTVKINEVIISYEDI